LVALSLSLDAPAAALFFLAIGVGNLGVIATRSFAFGRTMHRIVEHAARQVRLIPAETADDPAVAVANPLTS
jgi:hypothetical protein